MISVRSVQDEPFNAHFNFYNAARRIDGTQCTGKKNAVSVAWKVSTICLNSQCSPVGSWWEPPRQYNFDSFHSSDSLLFLLGLKLSEH